jgi:hypothetical protein
MRPHQLMVALAAMTLGGLACTKENNIAVTNDDPDASTKGGASIGQQCTGPQDKGCGVGAVCALGYCRSGCTTDAECLQGSICIGDRVPFGCALPAELACSSSQPCKAPLTCALDGKCRNGCTATSDCLRNEQTCIAGSCVSAADPDKRWSACTEGESACGTVVDPSLSCPQPVGACNDVYVCHRGSPGWTKIGRCYTDDSVHCSTMRVQGKPSIAGCTFPPPKLPPAGSCLDTLSVQSAGDACTLSAPSGIANCNPEVGASTCTLLVDGQPDPGPFTVDGSGLTIKLSAAACARISNGVHKLQIRICFN